MAQRRSRGISSVIPTKYRGVSFDRPPITEIEPTVLREGRAFIDNLDERLNGGQGMWLLGDVGTGKTSLAMLISKTALETGRSVAIYSLPRLLARIRRTYDATPGEQSYTEFFDRLASVDLLHLDDLGAEKRTDWVIEQLYAVINERYEQERSIIVTSNFESGKDDERDKLGAWHERLEREIGRRTVSRLVEICGDPLPLFGDDLRYRIAG